TSISTLSLHDALPISAGLVMLRPVQSRISTPLLTLGRAARLLPVLRTKRGSACSSRVFFRFPCGQASQRRLLSGPSWGEVLFPRSEEHTSELQSRFDL